MSPKPAVSLEKVLIVPVQTILNIIIALGIVGLLVFRQLRWRQFDPARALRLPVILTAIGIVLLARSGISTVSTVDVTFLVIELVLSVGIGAAMGRLTMFRDGAGSGHPREIRTGGWGASLWIVLIGARVGLDLLAGSLGGHLITQTGAILLLLGVSRATSALVVRGRLSRRVVTA